MVLDNLKITIVQSPLQWEDRDKNLKMFDKELSGLKGETDIIVLPEMFTIGFTMNAKVLAEKTRGKTLEWMQQKAAETVAAITGSIIAEEDGKYFNRLLWVNPDGTWYKYDKRHLFTMVGEDEHYTAGTERVIVNYKGWNILPLVCYDLRFPVWSRNTKQPNGEAEYDIMIFVANWPEVRKQPWRNLLLARAIENQAFIVGVNRGVKDENGIAYSGDSSLIDPYGEYIAECEVGKEQVLTSALNYQKLSNFRKKFPVLDDGDGFGFFDL